MTYSPRELDIQLADDTDADELRTQIDSALGDGGSVLWLTDKRGRVVGVPADKVAFVEISSDDDGRAFGFSS